MPTGTTGEYHVHFDRSLIGCVPVATVLGAVPNGTIPGYAVVGFENATEIGVVTFNLSGVPFDNAFDLLIEC